LEVIA